MLLKRITIQIYFIPSFPIVIFKCEIQLNSEPKSRITRYRNESCSNSTFVPPECIITIEQSEKSHSHKLWSLVTGIDKSGRFISRIPGPYSNHQACPMTAWTKLASFLLHSTSRSGADKMNCRCNFPKVNISILTRRKTPTVCGHWKCDDRVSCEVLRGGLLRTEKFAFILVQRFTIMVQYGDRWVCAKVLRNQLLRVDGKLSQKVWTESAVRRLQFYQIYQDLNADF